MDLILIIFITYYLGKIAAARGLSSYRWRFRFVLNCILIESIVGAASIFITDGDMITAEVSMFLALIGVILFQYERLRNLPEAERGEQQK